jgi:DNA-binding FrmR family transcriptional regulator
MDDCCSTDKKYPDHSAETPRLNRVSGQVEGIKKMIAERRYCPEILTQLRAARSALKTIEANILDAHLQSCIADAMTGVDKNQVTEKIEELKNIFKRFED